MTEPGSQETSPDEAPQSRARASTIGAVAFVLLSLPFLVFGGMMFNLKGLVALECSSGDTCALVHQSWLSRERVEVFTRDEIQGATLERNRSNRRGGVNLYRAVLETTRGKFPLSSRWLDNEAEAQGAVLMVNDFFPPPGGRGSHMGFTLSSDQRRGSAIVGSSFTSVGVLLLGMSGWLGLKARRHRRAERAARAGPSPSA